MPRLEVNQTAHSRIETFCTKALRNTHLLPSITKVTVRNLKANIDVRAKHKQMLFIRFHLEGYSVLIVSTDLRIIDLPEPGAEPFHHSIRLVRKRHSS
jgi:hypothetical protein